MRLFFVHGGPGMNNFAEEAILGPMLAARGHQAFFWNEPSRKRPTGDVFDAEDAFTRWVASFERALIHFSTPGPVLLCGHCFAATPALLVAERNPQRVAGLVLTGPSIDPFTGLLRVLGLAQRDLLEDQPELASRLATSMAGIRSLMDEPMCEAVRLALHDPKLFTHYWADPAQFQASMAASSVPEAQVDLESFFAVATDFARQSPRPPQPPVSTPTFVVGGALDVITPLTETRDEVVRAVPHARVEIIDGAGHFVHLDRPGPFIDLVADWMAGSVERARTA